MFSSKVPRGPASITRLPIIASCALAFVAALGLSANIQPSAFADEKTWSLDRDHDEGQDNREFYGARDGNEHGWFSGAEEHGFQITMNTPQGGIAQHSGQPTILSGTIEWLKAHAVGFTHPPRRLGHEIEVRAYFPDALHEVTSQVIFDWKNFTFQYQTPLLSAQDQNIFILSLRRKDPEGTGIRVRSPSSREPSFRFKSTTSSRNPVST